MVFYSLVKPIINKNGEQEMDIISVSQALQIAGRAGRFGTSFEKVHFVFIIIIIIIFYFFKMFIIGILNFDNDISFKSQIGICNYF